MFASAVYAKDVLSDLERVRSGLCPKSAQTGFSCGADAFRRHIDLLALDRPGRLPGRHRDTDPERRSADPDSLWRSSAGSAGAVRLETRTRRRLLRENSLGAQEETARDRRKRRGI